MVRMMMALATVAKRPEALLRFAAKQEDGGDDDDPRFD